MGKRAFLGAGAVLAFAGAALAQATFTDTFKGFSRNSKDPIQIEADQLEVFDKDGLAIFTGNVSVRQKEALLRTQKLKVFYEKKGDEPSAGNQNIRRMEAEGKVFMTQCDQTATGDAGTFDLKTDTAVLTGSVVLSQGPNVAQGDKLVVNTKTGQATLTSTGRVRMLVQPQSNDQDGAEKDRKKGEKKDPAKKDGEPKAAKPAREAKAKDPSADCGPTKTSAN